LPEKRRQPATEDIKATTLLPQHGDGALDIATMAIHAGIERRAADDPVVHPLFQSVNFVQPVGTGDGLRYPRYGNSPNAELVQRRLAALEGAECSILLSSGMGATACGRLAIHLPVEQLLASSWI
jgi:cystathionine beta-lyase/cystathionine gamma-synthase